MRHLISILSLLLCVGRLDAHTCASTEGHVELTKAIQLAEAYNWYGAKPHFVTALRLSKICAAEHDAVFAQIGLLRATMEQRNLAVLSRQLQDLINTPAVQQDRGLRLWAYIAKGDADQDLHYPATAKSDWELVKQLAKETNNPKWIYRADGELSIPAFYQGDVGSARNLVTEALAAASQAHDDASVVRLLTHIGTVYAMWQQYQSALEHLDKALKIAQHHPEQGYPLNVQQGRVMALLGQNHLEDAEKLATELIAVEQREDRRVNEAQTMITLASIYRTQKRPRRSAEELERAIRIATLGSYQQSLGNGEFALADLYRSEGNLNAAEIHAVRALKATHDSGMVSELPGRMAVLAALKAEQGQFAEADSLYGRAEDEVDSQLAFAPFSARPPLLKSESDIYTSHFALIADHSRPVEDAYRIIERIRGRSIYGLLRTGILSQSNGSEAAEKEIGSLRLRLAQATTGEQVTAIREQIFIAAHKRWLNNDEVSALRQSPDQIYPISAVQRNLQPGEVLIEYMQTPMSLYAVIVTTHEAHIAKLAKKPEVTAAAHAFLDAITAQRDAKREGLELWQSLLGGISELNNHSRLLIVPDADLYAIPFEAMSAPSGKLVVESHTIIRVPSASSYVLLRNKRSINLTGGLLAVGGVTYNKDVSAIAARRGWDGGKLGNLPSSEDEVLDAENALHGLMPTTKLDHTDATETAFKHAQLPNRKIIHLAIHGQASADTSDRAALFFLDEPEAQEDGVLEIPEIVRLPLRADLVVLSACETAVGPSQGEDGVLGLHRAFILAGARSVVATLWRIDDTFSEKLIRQFYAGLAGGMTTSEALVSAQRHILHQFSEKAVPYYWAGFILDGVDTRVVQSQSDGTARAGIN